MTRDDLERARRECRDVISGNVAFHDDPFAAKKPEPETVHEVCFAGLVGIAQCACNACKAEMGKA